MRANQLKGVVHDLLYLMIDFNPMYYVFLPEKREINLVTGNIACSEEDDIFKFYRKKVKWFKQRITALGGDLKDITQAKIEVFGKREKVLIKYKRHIFEEEIVF